MNLANDFGVKMLNSHGYTRSLSLRSLMSFFLKAHTDKPLTPAASQLITNRLSHVCVLCVPAGF